MFSSVDGDRAAAEGDEMANETGGADQVKAMAADEARAIFDAAIASGSQDPDRIANVEMLREYFCNPEFRAWMRDQVAKINGVR
jgi:hypothetical protein